MTRQVGDWTLEEEIGRGAMGIVHRASYQLKAGTFAVKEILGHMAQDEKLRQLFLREAATASDLIHKNIVRTYLPFQHEGALYFPMECLKGKALDALQHTRDEPWSVKETVKILRQASAGLGYAHSQNPAIVHRDIKPGNLFVCDDGTVKVLDFGLAKLN